MDVLRELEELAEEKYKQFNAKIIPTRQRTLGVRLPILRKFAKRIAKEDALEFVHADKQNIYELILLEGLVLSYMNKPFMENLPLVERFLDKVDNWAQVDSTICVCKHIVHEKEQVLAVIKRWLTSEKEFVVRAGLVTLLAHYVEERYLPEIFSLAESVSHQGYYVKMANAWLISVCMAKFPEETLPFFQHNSLDDTTQHKAIQKCRESYRVSTEHKEVLLEYKRE
ncbi:DNA alkylation repair protein [Desulfogranum japonicum]|uniref:DNA alkylation repair protein n=1 Tax=Desulfogranum japonicum TaxID=231447 RepID=UPI0004234618|nr:DNA alkylation repair protein [Desulfogranum japonicum]